MNVQTALVACMLLSPLTVHGLRLAHREQEEDSAKIYPINHKNTICVPCESPFLVKPVDRPKFLMCTPFKNGYEWWSDLFCMSQVRSKKEEESVNGQSIDELAAKKVAEAAKHGVYVPLWKARMNMETTVLNAKMAACRSDDYTSGYLKKARILDRLWEGRSTLEIRQIERDRRLPKYKLVRNPVTRALAAWLTWVGQHNEKVRMEGNEVEDHFDQFVAGKMQSVQNPHWSEQLKMCSWNEDKEPVKFTILKVEKRDEWGEETIKALQLKEELDISGGMGLQNSGHRCPGHGCSAAPLMRKYYTPKLFDQVVEYYKKDIEAFDYTEDVATWRDVIANPQPASGVKFDTNPEETSAESAVAFARKLPTDAMSQTDLKALHSLELAMLDEATLGSLDVFEA